ncbi:hypothetical protein FHX37_4063 [Haloactinospora alba]|uniref:Uncharacterized protein n=1 Tax=Haloactinospora alba TaxID=405555 RepID=A0A543NA69_9ACTN|nr:hypothetical protein [Haloactinospora alba]TQN28703.1 hypothetical protein FHX37_4063 [Haloactinospora alba]
MNLVEVFVGRRRVVLVALVLLVGGAAVGLASVGADRVPYTARESGTQHHTLLALLYFALVTLVDTYLGWCTVPVLLSYWSARSAKGAAGIGAAFALVALTVYALGEYLTQVFDSGERATRYPGPDDPPVPDPSMLDTAMWIVLSPMLPTAVVGAVLVAIAGYHARWRPPMLLVLAAAAVVDLRRRADTPWLSVANGLPNALLAAVGIAVVVGTVAVAFRTHRGPRAANSDEPV